MGSNTGKKIYKDLIEVYEDTGEPTGATKPNIPTDPDYIPPVEDLDMCPISSTTTTTIIPGEFIVGNKLIKLNNREGLTLSLESFVKDTDPITDLKGESLKTIVIKSCERTGSSYITQFLYQEVDILDQKNVEIDLEKLNREKLIYNIRSQSYPAGSLKIVWYGITESGKLTNDGNLYIYNEFSPGCVSPINQVDENGIKEDIELGISFNINTRQQSEKPFATYYGGEKPVKFEVVRISTFYKMFYKNVGDSPDSNSFDFNLKEAGEDNDFKFLYKNSEIAIGDFVDFKVTETLKNYVKEYFNERIDDFKVVSTGSLSGKVFFNDPKVLYENYIGGEPSYISIDKLFQLQLKIYDEFNNFVGESVMEYIITNTYES